MTEEISNTEDDIQYVYVKLINGDNILCATSEVIDDISEVGFLQVIDPIQIYSVKVPFKGLLVEKFMMQSWLPFSDTDVVNIPLQQVIFIGNLKEPFLSKYVEYVNDKSLSDSMGDEADEDTLNELSGINTPEDIDGNLEEEDIELEEFLESQKNINSTTTKKWLH